MTERQHGNIGFLRIMPGGMTHFAGNQTVDTEFKGFIECFGECASAGNNADMGDFPVGISEEAEIAFRSQFLIEDSRRFFQFWLSTSRHP